MLSVVSRVESPGILLRDDAMSAHVRNLTQEDIGASRVKRILTQEIFWHRLNVKSDQAEFSRSLHESTGLIT